jgi:predicted solute-binding protein
MKTIKIGSVPYLNARPLVNFFATPEGKSTQIEVVEAVPSKLAQMLEGGEISVALVSSIELVLLSARMARWRASNSFTGRRCHFIAFNLSP